ncbi:hypothetical protein JVU11DRAFT_6074 [Chiua virens]|nr:hypothetical protein JVU11DRAFT_6074 [Chiua virens]
MVDEHTQAAWDGFCKSHPGAAKYEDNPWPYWADVSPLISAVPKKAHIYCPAMAKSKQKQPRFSTDTTGIAASGTMNRLAKMTVHNVV